MSGSTVKAGRRQGLRKEVFPGITLFSLLLLVVAGLIGVVLTIVDLVDMFSGDFVTSGTDVLGVFSNDMSNLIQTLIMLVDIPLGLFVASLLSNRSKWAPFGMGGETIFYAFSILLTQNWALFIANGIYTPLIWVYGWFMWKDESILREEDEAAIVDEIQTKKLDLKSLLIILGTLIGVSVAFGAMLPCLLPKFFVASKGFMILNPASTAVIGFNVYIVDPASGIPEWFAWFQIWLDAFLAAVAVVATTMAVFRFAETWILFFISNVFKLLLFGITIAVTNTASAMMFVMAAAYFANALYGMIVWKDSEEVSLFDKEENKA